MKIWNDSRFMAALATHRRQGLTAKGMRGKGMTIAMDLLRRPGEKDGHVATVCFTLIVPEGQRLADDPTGVMRRVREEAFLNIDRKLREETEYTPFPVEGQK